jgi:hypothetical protein
MLLRIESVAVRETFIDAWPEKKLRYITPICNKILSTGNVCNKTRVGVAHCWQMRRSIMMSNITITTETFEK